MADNPSTSGLVVYIVKKSTKNLRKVERYVILTMLLLPTIFFLNVLKKRYFSVSIYKIMTTACYMLAPLLLTYTLGLMDFQSFRELYSIWAIFMLIGFASLDNLSAFSLEERRGRSKLFIQFLTNFIFLAIFFCYLHSFNAQSVPILLVCLVVFLKVVERIIALGHATGSTPWINRKLKNMIDYMNIDANVEVDPVSMKGYRYLVGPKYSETKDGVIAKGISIENIWECNGSLLSSESRGGDPDGRLKDICLSFSLFWLLLAKCRGYSLYKGNSRRNASKLVLNGLLSGKLGGVERVFRVIEVELSFLHDYYFSKYMVFYLHGFWTKLSFLSFPIIFWWAIWVTFDYKILLKHTLPRLIGTDVLFRHMNPMPTTIVIISVVSLVEVIQLWMLIASKWVKVVLISFYAKREMSKKKSRLLDCFFRKAVGVTLRVSQCFGATILSKPWKRELDQYSLLQSCTSNGVDNHFLSELTAVFGSPSLPKHGRKQGKSVVLSESVKRAVVMSLQTNGLGLSNGITSLKRNGVDQDLSWACNLELSVESIILVWHIATSVCEMFPESQQTSMQSKEDREVATTLSKYSAYLLVFSPSLLRVPSRQLEEKCDIAIKQARKIFKPHVPMRGSIEKDDMYEKLKEYLANDLEAPSFCAIRMGVKLGEFLNNNVGVEERKWKILAEFWVDMILFMASSNADEIAHIGKLAEGGEFITHLWALLIHVGIDI